MVGKRALNAGRRVTVAVGFEVAAFVLSMLGILLLLSVLGYPLDDVAAALWDGSLGSQAAISRSLSEAVPLMLTAIAVWVAFLCGIFTVGADGQLQAGGLAAVLVALHMPTEVPGAVVIAIAIVAGVLAGAVWAGIAALLKVLRGANEIISTIMLNFIMAAVILQLLSGPIASEEHPYTPRTDVPPTDRLIGELAPGVGVPVIVVIALVAVGAVLAMVLRTRIGLRLRAVGLNSRAALVSGVEVSRYQLLTFLLSGALAGLAGALVVLGYREYLSPGWAPAWGLLGIMIAFLSLRTPVLMVGWAVILGMIAAAGPTMKGQVGVPDAITIVMQTLPVIVLFALFAAARGVRFLRAGNGIEAGGKIADA